MKELLTKQLRNYIIDNHPDLWMNLLEEKRREEYLHNALDIIDTLLDKLIAENHPPYIIDEVCMEALTKPLRPSKYNYIKEIVEEKFPKQYEAFERNGILTTELINLLTICLPLFDAFNFSEETEEDERLRYVITRAVKEYFNSASVLTTRASFLRQEGSRREEA